MRLQETLPHKLLHMTISPYFHTSKIYIARTKTKLQISDCHRKFYRAFPVKFIKVTSSHGNFTTLSYTKNVVEDVGRGMKKFVGEVKKDV